MKNAEKNLALKLRSQGNSINYIAEHLKVAKSSVSVWVRSVELTEKQKQKLASKPFAHQAVEKRRLARLTSEAEKRKLVFSRSKNEIEALSERELWLVGTMLYWAEGGKTQRLVRFSNGDPSMIQLMMVFFRKFCKVPETKFRGYIHIHPHLDYKKAERYWSEVSGIPLEQFFKTYRKPNRSSGNKKNSLPNGVMDVYVLDAKLFLQLNGWAQGIFGSFNLGLPNQNRTDRMVTDARECWNR